MLLALWIACGHGHSRAAPDDDAAEDAGTPHDDAGSAVDAGDEDAGGTEDAGLGTFRCPDGTAAEEGCSVRDEVCPVEHPHPGAPCSGDLECEYRAGSGDAETIYTYVCAAGQWGVSTACANDPYFYMYPPTCDLAPPLVETCDAPFDGVIDGATVRIGPASNADAFRDFGLDERTEVIIGGQGSAMIEFRFQVACVEAPECVLIRSSASFGGVPEPTVSRVRLHCGESSSVYAIIPLPCTYEVEWLGLDLSVEVLGVGVGTARVQVPSDTGCMG